VTANEKTMIIRLKEIAEIPIFIIGTEIVFLLGILLIIRFAKKCSKFNI
jgi:hypothetical protein